jgi:lantibiotic modifying enzyme
VARQWGEGLLQGFNPVLVRLNSRPEAVVQPFAPFWHGQIGAAWALLALSRHCRENRFRQAALAMINEELASEQEVEQMVAPGLALGYLCVLPYVDDVATQARLCRRIEAALQVTLAHNFGQNHALGHGDLGYLELLWQASLGLKGGPWSCDWERQSAKVVASLQQHGWVTAIPLGVESPGLMAGLAGIGYGLLRLADPKRVPSILTLELPRK